MKLKIMRKLVMSLCLVFASVGFLTLNARADAVSFAGGFDLPGGSTMANATAFFDFTNITVTGSGGTGVFSPLVAGTALTMNGFSFNPLSNPTQMWTVQIPPVTGTVYSFDMNTAHIDLQDSTHIDLSGAGTAHIGLAPDIPGSWILQAGSLQGTFSFQGNSATVPEPATMLLLGSGLLGIGVYARKRFSKK
jgi:hypothetical protein